MTIDFLPEEAEFLVNQLLNPDVTMPQYLPEAKRTVAGKILYLAPLDSSDISLLQYVLQEQAEINGSRHSTANEKAGTVGPGMNFVPHRTLVLIKRITDKLGAHLSVDTKTKSDQTWPRQEGSTWIMTSPVNSDDAQGSGE